MDLNFEIENFVILKKNRLRNFKIGDVKILKLKS